MANLLTFTAAISLLLATASVADNPCTNGSFEQLAPSGFPADWGPIGATVEVSSDAHSGQRSLRFLRTAQTKTAETGLNRGPLIDRLKGGMDFYYKAISAKGAKLNVHVIPMTDQPLEATGSPRATFTVPEGHIGDGQWHHARLKYDFTANPKAKWVHFAVRILGAEGEMLLDDVSYVEQVGVILRFGKVRLEEDPERRGQRCTIRAEVQNAGDQAADDAAARLAAPGGLTATPAEVRLGGLAPDQKATAEWTLEGSRTKPCRLDFSATSGAADGNRGRQQVRLERGGRDHHRQVQLPSAPVPPAGLLWRLRVGAVAEHAVQYPRQRV